MATLSVWWELLAWRPAAQRSGLSGCLAFAHSPVLPRAPIGYPFRKFSPRVAKDTALPWGEGKTARNSKQLPEGRPAPAVGDGKGHLSGPAVSAGGETPQEIKLKPRLCVNLMLQLIHNEQKAS